MLSDILQYRKHLVPLKFQSELIFRDYNAIKKTKIQIEKTAAVKHCYLKVADMIPSLSAQLLRVSNFLHFPRHTKFSA